MKLLPLIALSVFTFTLNAELIGGVAILVKEEPITLFELKEVMQKEHLDLNKASELLIRKKLEANEIKERKISVNHDEVYDQIQKMAKQNNMSVSQLYEAMLSVRKLTQKELKAKIKESKLKEKLYNAIAMSNLSQPSSEDEEAYYKLHIDKYTRPEKFDIVVYSAKDKNDLQAKITNPMFYSPNCHSKNETMAYDKINPRLAQLLNKTKEGAFTPIIPSPDGGSMSFYVSAKVNTKAEDIESVRADIDNAIMEEARNQVLNDYFARLRLNAEIKMIRLPE